MVDASENRKVSGCLAGDVRIYPAVPDASVSLWGYLFRGGAGNFGDCGSAFASEAGVLEGKVSAGKIFLLNELASRNTMGPYNGRKINEKAHYICSYM